MKSFRNFTLLIAFSFSSLIVIGQEKSFIIEAKKGEVLDFLYLNTKIDVDSVKGQYFKTAFPVAGKHGYTPLGGLAIKDTPIQGNYHPEVLAMGKWPSKKEREVALIALENEVNGFHQMRREIWSTFNVVYFELKEDIKIEITPDRYYVTTNFWRKDNSKDFNKYIKSWESKVLSMNGTYVVQFTEGQAPFGYRFTPDYVSITSWKNKAEFDTFLKSSKKMDTECLQHINQLRVQ